MNIFVAKLDYNTDEETVRSEFEQFGEVDSVKIIMDRDTGRSKGFGFVEMPNDDEANKAIENLNDTDLDGRTIVVKQARPREESGRGGGGRRFDRGGGDRDRGGNRYDRDRSYDRDRNNRDRY